MSKVFEMHMRIPCLKTYLSHFILLLLAFFTFSSFKSVMYYWVSIYLFRGQCIRDKSFLVCPYVTMSWCNRYASFFICINQNFSDEAESNQFPEQLQIIKDFPITSKPGWRDCSTVLSNLSVKCLFVYFLLLLLIISSLDQELDAILV